LTTKAIGSWSDAAITELTRGPGSGAAVVPRVLPEVASVVVVCGADDAVGSSSLSPHPLTSSISPMTATIRGRRDRRIEEGSLTGGRIGAWWHDHVRSASSVGGGFLVSDSRPVLPMMPP
jgi:hypothetical protein